jgi:hypothetical protein
VCPHNTLTICTLKAWHRCMADATVAGLTATHPPTNLCNVVHSLGEAEVRRQKPENCLNAAREDKRWVGERQMVCIETRLVPDLDTCP